jgi:ATP-dependent DNA helicase RecQ
MMRRYAEHTGSRRSFLLSYFGQSTPVTGEVEPFATGERVVSERWGSGTVQRYDGDQMTVLFDEHGYRDLLVSLVVSRRLLRRA